MARVTLNEVKAWVEPTKLPITALESELLSHMEEEVLIRLSSSYDISGWTNDTNTPKIVRTIISKIYASFYIDKAYSENQDEGNDYAARLNENAEMLITGLVNGDFEIPNNPPDNPSTVSFYPTNASSAQKPTAKNPSLGGPHFSLGRVF
jgi:hypothetical protein